MAKVDRKIARKIEQILLSPRPTFTSPAEFALYLARELEPAIQAREELAYRMGEATSEAKREVLQDR